MAVLVQQDLLILFCILNSKVNMIYILIHVTLYMICIKCKTEIFLNVANYQAHTKAFPL